MKRPLAVFAAGFVLGEVLALQAYMVVDTRILMWLCAAAAGVLCLWHTVRDWFSGVGKRHEQGRSNLIYKVLLLSLSCFLAGCALGSGRGMRERELLDREETAAGEMAGVRIRVRGRVGRIEGREGGITLTLEDAVAEAGRKRAEFRRVLVYLEEEEIRNDGGADIRRDGDAERRRDGEAENAGIYEGEYAGAAEMDLAVGVEAVVQGSLEPVEGARNPGEFDFRIYYRSKGTACRMFGEKLQIVGGERIPYDNAVSDLRSWCAGILERICVPGDAAIYKAVLLGDTSAMDPGVRGMYQRHGISHLLAVSGQHLAIIGGGIYLILRRSGLGYGKAGCLSAMLVISYGVLTGSSGSAIRAVIMILCLWLAAAAGRSYDILSALGLAALILLYQKPYLLYHSGFQLSFGAVLAIGGLGNWAGAVMGVKRAWEKTLLISLCVQIVITPVVLYHYFQYPLYGIVLNLMVIPLVSVLMYSGILGIALGSFWLGGGMAAVGAGHYILRFYEWLCTRVELLPGYSLVIGRPGWMQMGLYGTGMAAAVIGIKVWAVRWNRDKKGNGDIMDVRPLVFLAVLLCSYILSFMTLLPHPVDGLEVVCLDVGQGDGLLLLTEEYTILVDGGSSSQKNMGSSTLEPYLKSRGITCIDYGIVSHGDSDHINGLSYLLEESRDIEINNLILPAMGEGKEVYQTLENLAKESGSQVSYMGTSELVQAGTLWMTCLYGGEDFAGQDRNSHSLVICADYGAFHMLFTGDMGEPQEKRLMELADDRGSIQDIHLHHVQLLKTAHHGSRTSSSEDFLDGLNVKLALISYGRGNSYGHPSPEVIERMEERDVAVLETGRAGAITLKTDGKNLWTYRFLEDE